VTGSRRLFGAGGAIAAHVRAEIARRVRLPASAGIAAVKFIAKIASDLRKPDGLVVVESGREAEFLAPLPIERLWGVGKATAKTLAGLGIATIGQLQRLPRTTLVTRLGEHGADLHELAFGRDERAVIAWAAPKSMGAETTFERDTDDRARLETTLRGQAERVARELRTGGVAASRVTLKLRFADFHTITRSHTGDPTQDGLELYRRVMALFTRERLVQRVRLIGVSASTLGPPASGQLGLLDPNAVRRERLARAVDGITGRFGPGVIRPATLMRRPRRPL
jgi:DNA polymerase-4